MRERKLRKGLDVTLFNVAHSIRIFYFNCLSIDYRIKWIACYCTIRVSSCKSRKKLQWYKTRHFERQKQRRGGESAEGTKFSPLFSQCCVVYFHLRFSHCGFSRKESAFNFSVYYTAKAHRSFSHNRAREIYGGERFLFLREKKDIFSCLRLLFIKFCTARTAVGEIARPGPIAARGLVPLPERRHPQGVRRRHLRAGSEVRFQLLLFDLLFYGLYALDSSSWPLAMFGRSSPSPRGGCGTGTSCSSSRTTSGRWRIYK